MRSVHHFINGTSVEGQSGRFGDIYNPNTGEIQAKVALATDAEVDRAVEAAKAALPEWAATNPQRRARILFKFKDLLELRLCGDLFTSRRQEMAASRALEQSEAKISLEPPEAPADRRCIEAGACGCVRQFRMPTDFQQKFKIIPVHTWSQPANMQVISACMGI